MAKLQMQEDPNAGQLMMQFSSLHRLAKIALVAIILVGMSIALCNSLASAEKDGSEWFLGWFIIISIFSVLILDYLKEVVIRIDKPNGTLTYTKRLLFIPYDSTTRFFTDLANIQIQFYPQYYWYESFSDGATSIKPPDSYRVVAIFKDGSQFRLNWDGKQDEMLALAQKISNLTGAEIIDVSSNISSSDQ